MFGGVLRGSGGSVLQHPLNSGRRSKSFSIWNLVFKESKTAAHCTHQENQKFHLVHTYN
ncbi:hypothetical protein BDA96_04G196600 [Sorghum bicolor]|uniref:Uncharacterized protein n=1 Tax=Sorghum bicolor TaxID=4558 RepID=A0A921R689_SORBI|nr:hypothetical protein BDA96_04G196600 [Sorghum bicolor]